MLAWQAKTQLRGLQPLPAWQGERQLRGLQRHSRWSAGSATGAQCEPEVKPDPEVKREPFTICGYFGLDE